MYTSNKTSPLYRYIIFRVYRAMAAAIVIQQPTLTSHSVFCVFFTPTPTNLPPV